ncbi:chalcone isomerase family protein, partial [Herbaspirillum sp. RTI4]
PPAPPTFIAQELPMARLAGQGNFTWFTLRIYHIQMWVGAAGYRQDAPDAAPFLLDLRYARTLDGQKIAEASASQMEKIGAGNSAQRQAWRLKMISIFPDVVEGDHLSGLFLPGIGARFYLNGKVLAEVPDLEFARAFFGIWLAPTSTAPDLRHALLQDAARP